MNMIHGIHLCDSIRDAYNKGNYEVIVKHLHDEAPDLKIPDTFMVIIKEDRPVAIPMTFAWGFCNTSGEVEELSQTLLAACELHFDKLRAEADDVHNDK
jgi:hypothetical protein